MAGNIESGNVAGDFGLDDSGRKIDIPTIDPSTIGNDAPDIGNSNGESEQPKRRRGRPASGNNSGNSRGSATNSKTNNKSAVGLEAILFSMHLMMANAMKIQEFSITPEESKKLAEAIASVNALYNINFDPRIMAWVGLTTAMTSIYAPRFVAYKMRMSNEAKKRKENEVTVQGSNQFT